MFYESKEPKVKWKHQLEVLVKVSWNKLTDFKRLSSSISFISIDWTGLGRGIKISSLLILLRNIKNYNW